MSSDTKQRRGKGTKPAMLHINVRLPEHVVDYFKLHTSYTAEMRRVLEEHVEESKYKNI
jgi:hypothetical protein